MWDAETNWAEGRPGPSISASRPRTSSTASLGPTRSSASSPTGRPMGRAARRCPCLPDHFDVIDNATAEKPFRLVAAPARTFLNSTFTETPSSQKREVRPTAMMNPEDCHGVGTWPMAIASRSATSAARPSCNAKAQDGGQQKRRRRGRGHLAQPELRDRHRHQRRDLGRSRLAERRRGVPRHRGLDSSKLA